MDQEKWKRIRAAVFETAVIAAIWLALRYQTGERRLPPIKHAMKWAAIGIFLVVVLELINIDMLESVPSAGKAAVSTKLLSIITGAK